MKKAFKEIKESWDLFSGPKQLTIFVVGVNLIFVATCWVLSPLWS